MYLAVTETIRGRAETGRFVDAARMERFVGSFADRYVRAYDGWRAGTGCPLSWRAAFEATRRWRPVILQHLLLGMNAHINLDLGVTASALGDGGALEAVRVDFAAMNDVLAELVDGCQQALNEVSPWLDLADHIGGGGDETMIQPGRGASPGVVDGDSARRHVGAAARRRDRRRRSGDRWRRSRRRASRIRGQLAAAVGAGTRARRTRRRDGPAGGGASNRPLTRMVGAL